MRRVIRETLISLRELALTAGPFVLLALALLAAAYYVLDPTPPRRVVLAAGPEQSDYAEFGKRYRTELARYGIDVVLRGTQGSIENRELLRDASQDVDLGFVDGGSSEAISPLDEEADDRVALVSLGSLFHEPVWIFYRLSSAGRLPGARLTGLAQLRGWRVNMGGTGSGVPNLMAKLLNANRVEASSLRISRLAQTPAVADFLGGRLDALVFASAPESPMIQMLLRTPRVALFEFVHAEAYARQFPFLNRVVMPRGVVDVARDLPPRDVTLIAPTAMLVAREGTHPALMQLLVQAASRIHGGTGWFARAGEFPSAENTELPIAKEAARFYKSGPPLLQQYLPFWLANLIDRMWVALVSIIAILIPLSRVVPPLYAFRIRSRIFRWYRHLRDIEDRLAEHAATHAELLGELDRLESKAERIVVPLAYTDELYALRSHIQLVRERIRS